MDEEPLPPFEADEDDPPPKEDWTGYCWSVFNRQAEAWLAFLRAIGLI